MRTPRALLVGLAAVTLGACASFMAFAGRHDTVRFPHGRHAEGGVECITCHEAVWDANSFADGERYLPEEKVCLGCHKKQKEAKDCAFCHSNPELAGPWVKKTAKIRIDHAAHIERTEEDCKVCHKTLPEPGEREGHAPPMSACLSCHEHQKMYDEGRCDTCHESLQRYPLQPIAEFSHGGDFVRRHGLVARTSADSCADCHDQNFCAECHSTQSPVRLEQLMPDRPDRGFIHRGDWLSRHSLEASLDSATCERCHAQSYCATCHTTQGLTAAGRTPRNPHPAGWAYPGAQSHAVPARQDIGSCAACHDEGPKSNCVTCHKAGGVGGDPHPPGWTDLHPKSEIPLNPMCLACHQ